MICSAAQQATCRFGMCEDEQKPAVPKRCIFDVLGRSARRRGGEWRRRCGGEARSRRGNLWTGIHRKGRVVHRYGRSWHGMLKANFRVSSRCSKSYWRASQGVLASPG